MEYRVANSNGFNKTKPTRHGLSSFHYEGIYTWCRKFSSKKYETIEDTTVDDKKDVNGMEHLHSKI